MRICQAQNSHSDLFNSKANFFFKSQQGMGGSGKEAAEEVCGLGEGGRREGKTNAEEERLTNGHPDRGRRDREKERALGKKEGWKDLLNS